MFFDVGDLSRDRVSRVDVVAESDTSKRARMRTSAAALRPAAETYDASRQPGRHPVVPSGTFLLSAAVKVWSNTHSVAYSCLRRACVAVVTPRRRTKIPELARC